MCSKLTEISGIGHVESVGKGAFHGCSSLPHLYLPASCWVDVTAFRDTAATGFFSFGYSVGKHPFYGTHPPAERSLVLDPASAPVDLVAKDPFDVLVAMEATRLAYSDDVQEGATISLGTSTTPFIVLGGHSHAKLEVRRFFKASASVQMQKLTLLAEVHVQGELVRRLLVLGFRGTADVADAVRDAFTAFDKGAFANEEVHVHGGFALAVSDPEEHAQFLEALADSAALKIDGLLITGHSLGGAVAQVAALHARKLHGMLTNSEVPSQYALRPVFEKLAADQAKRESVLHLLDTLRCITFESPTPFAPKRDPKHRGEQAAALEWLGAHAVNYCCATDPVPLVPQHLSELLDALHKAVPQITDKYATDLARIYLKYTDDTFGLKLVDTVPDAVTKKRVRDGIKTALTKAREFTETMREPSKEFMPLASTIYIGPDEPAQGAAFKSRSGSALRTEQARRLEKLLAGGVEALISDGVQWHLMENVAPFVRASIGVSKVPVARSRSKDEL